MNAPHDQNRTAATGAEPATLTAHPHAADVGTEGAQVAPNAPPGAPGFELLEVRGPGGMADKVGAHSFPFIAIGAPAAQLNEPWIVGRRKGFL